MFDFLKFKSQVAQVGDQLKSLNLQIQSKNNELNYLKTSHPQKADIISHYDSIVDHLASQYDEALEFSIKTIASDPLDFSQRYGTFGTRIITATRAGVQNSPQDMEAAIIALFKDQIKTSMHKIIESIEWPADAGPLQSDRPALIQKCGEELAALRAEKENLIKQAAQAGITISS